MIFLIVDATGYVLVTLIGALAQNHDICLKKRRLLLGHCAKSTGSRYKSVSDLVIWQDRILTSLTRRNFGQLSEDELKQDGSDRDCWKRTTWSACDRRPM